MDLYFQQQPQRGVTILVQCFLLLASIYMESFCRSTDDKYSQRMAAENFTCSRGDYFKIDCRFCVCDPETFIYILCQKKPCRRKPPCEPFVSFSFNCTFCTCMKNGQQFCALNFCNSKSSKSRGLFCKGDYCKNKLQNYMSLQFVPKDTKKHHRQCKT